MKTCPVPIPVLKSCAAMVVLATFVPLSLSAQSRAPNPTSKFFVAELRGEAAVDTGERIEELTERSVHQAEGTVVETTPVSQNAMVFSNSAGVFLDRDTRIEIRRFSQEPFLPNRTDLEVEPSISRQEVFVSRGAVGVCPARPVPGSVMRYSTNLGSINVRGGQMVVESDDHETRFSLVSGDVTVNQGDSDTGGTLLQPGQQAVIRRMPGRPPEFFVRPIPEDARPAIEEKATMACMARRTVYFDVVEQEINDRTGNVFFEETTPEGEEAPTEDNLVVVEVIPAEPTAPPLSASRIPGP